MIIANTVKDFIAAVHLAADGSQVATGTIYCVVRLESDDVDDGKFWDSNDDTWQASPVSWPTATHTQAGQWAFALPAAATSGKTGDTISYTFTDHLTEASATTVCGGGEHHIWTEDPLMTSDLSNLDAAISTRSTPAQITTAESNIRGSDSDDLKDISDEIASLNNLSSAEANAACDQAFSDYDPPTKTELDSAETAIIAEIDANETKIDALPDAVTINAQCDQALTDYDAPTKAELDTAQAAILAAIVAVNDPTAANIAAAVWDALMTDYETANTMGWLQNMMNDPRILPGD